MSLESEEDQTELLRSIDEAILKIQELAEELIENSYDDVKTMKR